MGGKPHDFKPTHIHRDSGNQYEVIARGHNCTNGVPISPVVVYRDAMGDVWVRYAPEFDDGRFVSNNPN